MQDRINRQNLKVRLPIISCALLGAAVLTLALKLAEITGHPEPWMLLAWMIGLSALGTVILFALAGTTDQRANVRQRPKIRNCRNTGNAADQNFYDQSLHEIIKQQGNPLKIRILPNEDPNASPYKNAKQLGQELFEANQNPNAVRAAAPETTVQGHDHGGTDMTSDHVHLKTRQVSSKTLQKRLAVLQS